MWQKKSQNSGRQYYMYTCMVLVIDQWIPCNHADLYFALTFTTLIQSAVYYVFWYSHTEDPHSAAISCALFVSRQKLWAAETKGGQRSEIGELTGYHFAGENYHLAGVKISQDITWLEKNLTNCHLDGKGLRGYHLAGEKSCKLSPRWEKSKESL